MTSGMARPQSSSFPHPPRTVGILMTWEGGEGREGYDLKLQALSLISLAISRFKGHHNYDCDKSKTMPAYLG